MVILKDKILKVTNEHKVDNKEVLHVITSFIYSRETRVENITNVVIDMLKIYNLDVMLYRFKCHSFFYCSINFNRLHVCLKLLCEHFKVSSSIGESI